MNRALLGILLCALASAGVKVTKLTDRVRVEIDGQPFGDFVYGPDVWKPYFYPLRSASGKIVTRQFPMEQVPAEKDIEKDHPHHRGLFFAHGEVSGVNFWAGDPLVKTDPTFGKIVCRTVNTGKNSISLTADWVAPNGKTLLTETRTMAFSGDKELRIVDLNLKLTAKDKVVFEDTKEGTLALRLSPLLKNAKMVNAEGKTGEPNVWGKRSPWMNYSGVIDGERVAVAVFDHPENPRHPGRWHARAYGLFAMNPFGLGAFTGDKSANGAMTVEAKKNLRFRYRIVIHSDADIAGMYLNWAK